MMLVWNNLADPHLSAFSDFTRFSQTLTLNCDCAIIWKPKFCDPRSKRRHPIIFRVLFHDFYDSTLVCSIVGTVCVATLTLLSSWLRLNMFGNEEFMEEVASYECAYHPNNKDFKLKTRTKRPTFGTKSSRSFIYRPGK